MKQLHLTKPLVIFDLETTGIDTATARIVEISCVKVEPYGDTTTFTTKVNPGIPIPNSHIHRITDEEVADAPRFKDCAKYLVKFMGGCDLGGHNVIAYDLPILTNEMTRAGFPNFPDSGTCIVDTLVIARQYINNKLGTLYELLFGVLLEDAHTAEADTVATLAVLRKLVSNLSAVPNEVEKLAAPPKMRSLNPDTPLQFGKYKGKTCAEVVKIDRSYAKWFAREGKNVAIAAAFLAALKGKE